MKFLVLGLLTLGALAIGPAAYATPQLVDVSHREVVAVDADGNFVFDYTLSTGAASDGDLFIFSVSLKRPAGSAALSAEGLSIQVIPSNAVPFTTLSADLNIDTSIFVPVGCTPPVGWTCLLSVAPAVFWAFRDPSDAILPGMTRGGYRLVSPALPRIVGGFVKPHHVLFTEGDEFQESDRERGRLEVAAITVPLRLLGPVPPPEPLDLAAYTAMIAAELPEAQALGWIDTSTTLGTLLGPLGGLELALQEDRTSDAKAIVSSLIAQVSESSCTTIACSEKPLSVEAFALLNFNLRFIRSKLPNSAPD